MRYAASGEVEISERPAFDVVIIGAGIAGLYTALNLDEHLSCCLLTKQGVEISNSWLAQGGIAAAISSDDTPELHFDDTLIAGAGLCDEAAVHVLVEEGPEDIKTLVRMNVPFDINADGDLQITREGGHRKNRIVHAGGDATGKETVKSLARLVATRHNVAFMGNSFFIDVLTDDGGNVSGALILGSDGEYRILESPNIVLATGGIGQIYESSTNPAIATGDGIAAAMRAGARLRDMEFIQFHPTGLWTSGAEGKAFLISEAVRGEGGLLKNSKGERFMDGAHELAELAPRDIVARGIVEELKKSGEDHVFVDVTGKPREFLSRRFPTIYAECMSRGIDIARDWIPVCPVQHYLIGGIYTDLHARTTVPGLYACGEAASTGVHGANRLASNSMLECLVFGRRAAQSINGSFEMGTTATSPADLPELPVRGAVNFDLAEIREEIQRLMSAYGGVIRGNRDLRLALERMCEIRAALEDSFQPGTSYIEALNLAQIACTILDGALKRHESIGAHFKIIQE